MSTTKGQGNDRAEQALATLLRQAKVWRAGEIAASPGIPSHFPALDGLLANRGWPRSALTEILTDQEGIGALRLVLPALANMSQTQWLVWVCPPYVPYAPALQAAGIALERMLIVDPGEKQKADQEYLLWVFEQALRFADCGVALTWLNTANHIRLRRLQLAAEQGQTWGVIFRPLSFATQASPASLRLSLSPNGDGTSNIRILKSQGSLRTRTCQLDL